MKKAIVKMLLLAMLCLLMPEEITKAEELTGTEAVYQNNLTVYTNQRSDEKMMEYLLMEPDDVYAFGIDDEIRQTCADITAECTTDMQKLEAIYDWICSNLYYDQYGLANTGTIAASGPVFYYKGTKCEGFAHLLSSMCRESGIPCKEMWGYTLDTGQDNFEQMTIEDMSQDSRFSHAWNEAWIDGRWVLMDATWDCKNANTADSPEVTYREHTWEWFDVELEQFSKTHLFSSYISLFETLFDQWLQTQDSSIPVVTQEPDSTPTPTASAVPFTNPAAEETIKPTETATSSYTGQGSSSSTKNSSQKTEKAGTSRTSVSRVPRVSGVKVKSKKGGSVRITWKKISGAEGYNVQTAGNRTFTKGKKSRKTSSSRLTMRAKKGNICYVRVRAYKKSGGKTTYGSWSRVIKCRVK